MRFIKNVCLYGRLDEISQDSTGDTLIVHLATPGILLGISLCTFLFTLLLLRALMPLLRQSGIVGHDKNKASEPLVPEMGGLALVAGISIRVPAPYRREYLCSCSA